MTERAAWLAYRDAVETFITAPSIPNEARAIATYAEWVRSSHPDAADYLIGLFCRHTAGISSRRAAA
jgi:hypothetical protein